MHSIQSDRLYAGDSIVEGPTPARYWGDHWLRVSEKLLKGLNHQLTNRVSSLEGAIELLKTGDLPDATFVESMAQEVARLHGLLILYRQLTAEPFMDPEATRLQDLVPQAVRLHEHHYDLRHYPCVLNGDNETAPVCVRQSAFLRCVLVLLGSASGNALRSGRDGVVAVEYGTDSGESYLRMSGPAPDGQLLFTGEGSLLHAARSALAHAHGTAEGFISRSDAGDTMSYEIRLPVLGGERGEG